MPAILTRLLSVGVSAVLLGLTGSQALAEAGDVALSNGSGGFASTPWLNYSSGENLFRIGETVKFSSRVFSFKEGERNGGLELAPWDGGIDFISGNDAITYFDFKGNGNLGAGYVGRILHDDSKGFLFTGTSNDFKVAVDGKLMAKEIEVATSVWPDYVFAADYALKDLDRLEAEVKAQGKLPGLPSAEEVSAQGQNLGQVQIKLLEKLEELTLYVFELNQRLKAQEEQLQALVR